jgi:hypothetical protein
VITPLTTRYAYGTRVANDVGCHDPNGTTAPTATNAAGSNGNIGANKVSTVPTSSEDRTGNGGRAVGRNQYGATASTTARTEGLRCSTPGSASTAGTADQG